MAKWTVAAGISSLAIMVAATATGAAAQDTTSAPQADQVGDPRGISGGEIVVTARRREESVQTVPISVSVVGGEKIGELGLQTTGDLQRLVPGVLLNGAGSMSNSTYTIRGQGKAVTGPGLLSVVTYVNDVPLPPIGSFAPVFDLQGVQVLKGPQGTLFGRNTTGGAVLVNTRAPSYNLEGYVQADIGNYGKHSFQGAVNVPLVADRLAVRLAADIQRNDGFTRNITTGLSGIPCVGGRLNITPPWL